MLNVVPRDRKYTFSLLCSFRDETIPECDDQLVALDGDNVYVGEDNTPIEEEDLLLYDGCWKRVTILVNGNAGSLQISIDGTSRTVKQNNALLLDAPVEL